MHSTTSRMPDRASSSSCQSTNGRPATSSSDFGTRSVCGSIRVASPPASTTACIGISELTGPAG